MCLPPPILGKVARTPVLTHVNNTAVQTRQAVHTRCYGTDHLLRFTVRRRYDSAHLAERQVYFPDRVVAREPVVVVNMQVKHSRLQLVHRISWAERNASVIMCTYPARKIAGASARVQDILNGRTLRSVILCTECPEPNISGASAYITEYRN